MLSATQEDGEEFYREIVSAHATQDSLSAVERQQVFKEAVNHKVASPAVVSKYDPTGEIGFCFGRAMAVHLLARQHGLARDSIRKLFVIGDLRFSESAETDYFMQVGESRADSFPFVALQINETRFPFRDYFFDLFRSFLN